MAHHVFLSYQRGSQSQVDAVRRALEDHHLACWMDRSDLNSGDDWNRMINNAMADSQVFVLFLTAACEQSTYVKHEVLAADGMGLAILPVRLENFQPTTDPLTRVSRFNYLDAFEDPIENYLNKIVAAVRQKVLDCQQASRLAGSVPQPGLRLTGSPVADIGNLVYEAWIPGFLMPTITGLAIKEGHDEGIDRPYTFLDPTGKTLSRSSSKTPLSKLLKQANGRLMISGVQGSGKTVLMLQLVRELLPIPENIHDTSAPLYLHVGTWADPHKAADRQPKIRDWIQSRLMREYHIHKDRAAELIANRDLIYCFDGLDDLCEKQTLRNAAGSVAEEAKNDAYRRRLMQVFCAELAHLIGDNDVRVIVTAGPTTESLLRQEALPFYTARIDPWTHEDLLRYLNQRGIGALAAFLNTHPEIEERLIRSFSELQMLGTVFKDGDEVQALEDLAQQGIDRFFSAVYDKYLKIKYDRYSKDVRDGRVLSPGTPEGDRRAGSRKPSRARISLTEITRHVPAIAAYIEQPGKGESFRLDMLQPYELANKEIQQQYRLYAGLLIGGGIALTAGLPVTLSIFIEWLQKDVALSRALTQSLLAVAGYVLVGLIAAFGYRFARGWGFGAFVGLAFAVAKAFASGCSASAPPYDPGWDAALHNGVTFLIAIPIFAAVFWQIREDPYEIVPIEMWDPDTSKIGYWMAGAVAVAGFFFATMGWVRGIIFGVLFAVFAWARFGRKPKMAPLRLRPNQAILYSRENALWHAVGITLISSAVTGITYGIAYGLKDGILDAVMALGAMVVVFFFGGIPVMKHVALRRALTRAGLISARLEIWLQTAVGIGLLRQVGGGYAFASEDSRRQYALRMSRDAKLSGLQWGLSRLNEAPSADRTV